MSTASATASSTRSSSPATSDSPSDDHSPFQQVDFSAWLNTSSPASDNLSWPTQEDIIDRKHEDHNMLIFEEFMRDNLAFEQVTPDSPVAINPAVFQLSQNRADSSKPLAVLNTNIFSNPNSNFSSDNSSSESGAAPSDLLLTSAHPPFSITKVVPPPPLIPRKLDQSTASHRVVYPAKESCYNLVILTPNIPQSGTKSRVETQVRVALDLALASGSSGDPHKYDRVGSWKWLKLPKGTATRKRSRKEGKIDASPLDTLFLDAEVTCSSNPAKQVTSCSTCQGREAKRVARKIAARIRPARSDSDSNDGPSSREGDYAGNIIQFNCPDTLDFSSGSVVLPLRITCYCRHHREKVGFNVHFTMKDDSGRIVGKGMSPPIMITDDHKSSGVNAPSKLQQSPSQLQTPVSASSAFPSIVDGDWEPRTPLIMNSPATTVSDFGAPSRRMSLRQATNQAKKRAKPYDSSGRNASTASASSGPRTRRSETTEGNVYPTVVPVPTNPYPDTSSVAQHFGSASPASVHASCTNSGTAPPSPQPSQQHQHHYFEEPEPIRVLPSPPHSFTSPTSPQISSSFFDVQSSMLPEASPSTSILQSSSTYLPLSPPETAPSSPPLSDILAPSLSSSRMDLSALTYQLFPNHSEPPSVPTLPAPKIHRLIPASGPTFGGIEITVLGTNFHSSVLYECVFGDVSASSTSRWSENTLVCILPPSAVPGVVPVTLKGIKLEEESSEPVLFTYVDETDRSLMELALQIVGLKMTGKYEDAKSIAMRIVGTSNQDPQNNGNNVGLSQMTNLASASGFVPDARRLLLSQTDDAGFEKLIMDALSVLDKYDDRLPEPLTPSLSSIISHKSKTGQTLLHLAAFLNFPSLVELLIQLEIELDARDANGCTALHFAAIKGSQCCARLLVNAGADIRIEDDMGRSPLDLASAEFFGRLLTRSLSSSDVRVHEESDEESQWGDAEEDAEDAPVIRRRARKSRSRRSSKPASVASDASDAECEPDQDRDDDNFEDADFEDEDDGATIVSPDSPPMLSSPEPGVSKGKIDGDAAIDEKQAASIADFFHRAWGQFQNQQIMPQMPNMPQLPGVPAWVFPVFVPMPGWPPFRGEKEKRQDDGTGIDKGKIIDNENDSVNVGAGEESRSEWRMYYEKWMAQMSAAMARQQQGQLTAPQEDSAFKSTATPAPVVPAEIESDTTDPTVPARVPSRSLLRRFGYNQVPISESEVNAYTYRPSTIRRAVKKEDRMLVLFWIPALILALGWALYTSFPVALALVKTYLPFAESVAGLA